MSDPTLPPPLHSTPDDAQAGQPASAPVGNGTLVLGVLALLAGLVCLIPGSLCTLMAIGMQFGGDRESSQIGGLMAVFAVPALIVGVLLTVFAIRRLRRASRKS